MLLFEPEAAAGEVLDSRELLGIAPTGDGLLRSRVCGRRGPDCDELGLGVGEARIAEEGAVRLADSDADVPRAAGRPTGVAKLLVAAEAGPAGVVEEYWTSLTAEPGTEEGVPVASPSIVIGERRSDSEEGDRRPDSLGVGVGTVKPRGRV